MHIAKNFPSGENNSIDIEQNQANINLANQNIDVSSNVSNNINNISINNSLIMDERYYNFQNGSNGNSSGSDRIVNKINANKKFNIDGLMNNITTNSVYLKQIAKNVTTVMKSWNESSRNMFNEIKIVKSMIEKLNCAQNINNINNQIQKNQRHTANINSHKDTFRFNTTMYVDYIMKSTLDA